MKTRIISGAVLFAILIPTLIIGGNLLLAVLCLVSCGGIYELSKVFKQEKSLLMFIAFAANIFLYAGMVLIKEIYFIVELVIFFLFILVCYVIEYPKYKLNEVVVPLLAFVYAGVLMSYIYRIRMNDSGIYLVWLIFISSWLCDTCAYFSGVFLGKHKAFPVLSPKKTWEGCIGGVLGATVIGTGFAAVFADKITVFKYPIPAIALIVFVCSILSIFGDLAASAIKRENNIKDYSNLIPGHGGIMDRFDSVIFVSPLIFYFINLLEKVM
ncbi:MAG: phosphatidate cytidylyltransferase [Lachnospiraceae bacterium]|nr:phosphatidate cytidylyltransferase [Lachnospiraceae bacterium]